MQFVDSWRLFGPNLQTRGPAALAEVSFGPSERESDVDAGVRAWKQELARMSADSGVSIGDAEARVYRGGAVLTFSSPLDVLLPMTDLDEWAAKSAVSIASGEGPLPLEPTRTELLAAFAARRSPTLLALEAEATQRAIPMTCDDDGVTLGAGKTSQTWAPDALPEVGDVPWGDLRAIPVALVTGTNGKTTSARLLARLLRCAGRHVGMTTTDGVWVDEAPVLSGDYTGPAGAATVLRRPDVDAAVLETARGGILRRGLAVRTADVALLTNVSDDHLGHYGIDDLAALAKVKAVVGTVVRREGRVVVNADDPHLMAEAPSFAAPMVLFSVDPGSAPLAAHVAGGGEAWALQEGWLVRLAHADVVRIVPAGDVPIGFGGAARYNLANALGAAAAAHALGVSDDLLRAGLTGFTSSSTDNPGRGNLVEVAGVSVRIDFAHNPDGIRSVLALAASLRARASGRLILVAGYAGDRSNESIRDAARVMASAAPTRVFLRDLGGYLRGRAPLEVPERLASELAAFGVARDAMEVLGSEALALRAALASATAGDLIVILAHLETEAVHAVIDEWRTK